MILTCDTCCTVQEEDVYEVLDSSVVPICRNCGADLDLTIARDRILLAVLRRLDSEAAHNGLPTVTEENGL